MIQTFPKLAWGDHDSWTSAVISSVMVSTLPDLEPLDVESWFSDYTEKNRERRGLYWCHLISAITKPESNFNPRCVEKGDVDGTDSLGLLQLSVEDGPNYHLTMRPTREELLTPGINLQFGVLIMEKLIVKDRRISSAFKPWLGPSEYWSTMRAGRDGYDFIKGYVTSVRL